MMDGVELRHLNCFVVVAQEQNFTRAAARLNLVQSAVSAAIKALERELGATLFDRGQPVTLTDAGAALLPRAQETLDAARAATDAVDQVRGGLRGTVRIGTMLSISLFDLPALLGRFHRAHPMVTIQVRAAPRGSAGLAESLLDGSLDVAFLSVPGPAPQGLTVRTLASVPIVLVVPADHRLAGRGTVPLRSLAGEAFVDFPQGYGNRAVVDRAFLTAGVERDVTLEAVDIALGAQFVRHGLGLALLPDYIVPDDPELQVVRIADPALSWDFSVATATRRRPSAAAREVLARAEQFLVPPLG